MLYFFLELLPQEISYNNSIYTGREKRDGDVKNKELVQDFQASNVKLKPLTQALVSLLAFAPYRRVCIHTYIG